MTKIRMPLYTFIFLALATSISIASAKTQEPAALTIEDFLLEADLRSAKISPNGRYLATIRSENGIRFVTIRDLSKPDYPTTGSFGDNIVRPNAITWANNKRLLVTLQIPEGTKSVRKDAEKDDNFDINDYFMFERVISVDINGKNQVEMLNDRKSLEGNVRLSKIWKIKNDSNSVIIPAYRRGLSHLYKVNVKTGKSEHIAQGGKRTFYYVIDDDGKPLYRFDHFWGSNRVVIRKFISAIHWKKIDAINFDDEAEDTDNLSIQNIVGTYKKQLAYRKLNKRTGYNEIVVRNPIDGSIQTLVALENHDIDGIYHDAFGEVIGYYAQNDLKRYVFFNKKLQKKYDHIAKNFENANFYFYDGWQKPRSIIKMYGRNMPGAFYLYNNKKDVLTFIQDSYSHLPIQKLALPAKIIIRSRDNLKIDTYVLLPPGFEKGKAYPMVVLPHGGPHARDDAGYDEFAQFIATRGYLVIQPNFRGSTGYGKDFLHAGYKQWGQKMQEDLEDATNFMVNKGYADKNKICIAGLSYGGYAALMGAIKTPELFQCSISINGVTDLLDQISHFKEINISDNIDEYLNKVIGDPKNNRDMLKQFSPVRRAEDVQVPILLMSGKLDDVVPYKQARKMKSELKKAKKDFRFIELENSGHNPFCDVEDYEIVYTEVEKFLAKHLNPEKQGL